MKQLTSMGRGPFFGGARKMRGFPMNLSPGMDDAGFPFYGHDGKFEFGYGGPQFHPHSDAPFFPGHPIGPIPFNGAGKHYHFSSASIQNQSMNLFENLIEKKNFIFFKQVDQWIIQTQCQW